jgi:XRE family aerobic/anaerobic benzoate catabolism transcriptional regulator
VEPAPPAAGELRIALIGARGAGKSTVGARLAALLGLPFVDLDRETSPEEPAGALLARLGAPAFRARELAALERVLQRPGSFVLAAGGGVVETGAARALLGGGARCVWLRAPPALLRARLAADPAPRPPLDGADALAEIEDVLRRREPLYAALACSTVDAALAPERVARAAAGALGLLRAL